MFFEQSQPRGGGAHLSGVFAPTPRASPWRRAPPAETSPPGSPDAARPAGRLSVQTVELLFAQQNEMGESLEARLNGTVDALRDEVRELQARLERQQLELQRAGSVPTQVEQAVRDALSLYADGSAGALSALSDELSRPPDAPPPAPSQYLEVCRAVRSSLATFVSSLITRQLSSLWEDAAATVPHTVRRHVGEIVKTWQDNLNLVSDDIRSVLTQHPLAPRVAALETQVSQQGAKHRQGLTEEESEAVATAHLKVADVERRYDAVEQQFEELAKRLVGKVEESEAEAAKTTNQITDVIKSYHEEVWQHIGTTEEMLERALAGVQDDVSGMRAELEAEQQRGESWQRPLERIHNDMRTLRSDLTAQVAESASTTLRGANDAVGRVREDMTACLADARRELLPKAEFLAERKRTLDALDKIKDAVDDAETRAVETALGTLEAAKATTSARLQQLEDEVQQLQGAAADAKYTKTALDNVTAKLEDGERKREAAERDVRRLEEKVAKQLTHEHLEQRDRDLQRMLAELEAKLSTRRGDTEAFENLRQEVDSLRRRLEEAAETIGRRVALKADRDSLAPILDDISALRQALDEQRLLVEGGLLKQGDLDKLNEKFQVKIMELTRDVRVELDGVASLAEAKAEVGWVEDMLAKVQGVIEERMNAFEAKAVENARLLAEIDEHLQMGLPTLAGRLEDIEEVGRVLTEQLGETNDNHGAFRDSLSVCNQSIAKLDGYVRQLAGDRDTALEEMQAKLQDVSSRQEIETQQLRRLVEKAGIALETFASQPGTPKLVPIGDSSFASGVGLDNQSFTRSSFRGGIARHPSEGASRLGKPISPLGVDSQSMEEGF